MRRHSFALLAVALAATTAYGTIYYVATTGNDANDGLSAQSAFLTLAQAVATAGENEAEILIAPGTYTQTAAIRVEAPLSIRGTGAAATNVVLKNTTSGQHVITIAHADAELALVQLTGGSAGSGPACLGIEAGLVRDCWVTGCSYGMGRTVTGGTVLMSGGRLMRSVIRDNTITGTGWNSVFSAGVQASAGVVENCLIANNSQRAYNDKGAIETSALSMAGTAQAVNCTVVGNSSTMNGSGRKPMTTYAASDAKIVNCVIFGNTSVVADYTVWAGTAANYVNCAADSGTAINSTCITMSTPAFADAAVGDYAPTYASPFRDAGSNVDYAAAAISETDIKGDNRVLNDTIDAGAYEYVPSSNMAVDFSFTVNQRLLPASVAFSALIENAPGAVVYRWDFDSDGTVDLETSDATITNTFSVAKVYDVTLTAVSGQKTATAVKYQAFGTIQKDVYVATDGSDDYPYATPATASTTIHAALAAADDGCAVHVLPGTYSQSVPFALDKAVSLSSTTTNAADVVLRNTASDQRIAEVSDEGAELAGVTLTNGKGSPLGAALTLTAGLVRDCTVTGNSTGGAKGQSSGAVWMSGGRLMRCRIVANSGGTGWNADCGAVNATGGIVDTCLVATNRVSYWGDSYTTALGVKLTGTATAVNCTIANNVCSNPGADGTYPMATHAGSNARFVNCLIWENATEDGDTQNYVWHGTAASYVNCYSELAINETSPSTADPGFMTRGAEPYAIRAGSPLSDKGADYAAAGGLSAFDLSLERPRQIGSHVDIGCFEANASGTVIIVK
jgi:PKD repeat protein